MGSLSLAYGAQNLAFEMGTPEKKMTAEVGYFNPGAALMGGAVKMDRDCKMALCRLLGLSEEVGGSQR